MKNSKKGRMLKIAEGLEAEAAAKTKAGYVELRETFKRGFLQEGKTEEQAEKMADIAARGRA